MFSSIIVSIVRISFSLAHLSESLKASTMVERASWIEARTLGGSVDIAAKNDASMERSLRTSSGTLMIKRQVESVNH